MVKRYKKSNLVAYTPVSRGLFTDKFSKNYNEREGNERMMTREEIFETQAEALRRGKAVEQDSGQRPILTERNFGIHNKHMYVLTR